MRRDVVIKWTHIGGGPLLSMLESRAQHAFSSLNNISYSFTGTLPRTRVGEIYARERTDIFINLSESEGVPVSIMEAMSYGIPAIAPDIGGVVSLVDDQTGVLLSAEAGVEEAAQALIKVIDPALCGDGKNESIRLRKDCREFNSNINYPLFMQELHAIASGA
ncbi:MAG: glycosyltransferase [Halioglobus sp.]|nr:glycosyltransferase [Halioglobus sp.]